MGGRLFRGQIVDSDDTGEMQTVTLLGQPGETIKNVHRIQPHGFTSNMPADSHGFGVQFGGADGGRVLNAFFGGEHQDKRPRKVPVGGSVVYDAAGNVSRYLGDDGIWHDAGSRSQKMTGKTINITGTDKVVVQVGGTTVTVTANRVDLGGEGGQPVMTQGGPSSVVFAKV